MTGSPCDYAIRLHTLFDTLKENSDLYDALLYAQYKSLVRDTIWKRVCDWQRRPDLGHWWTPHSIGHYTSREWGSLRKRLDQGNPTILMLIRAEGYFANPTENHQVLAYRYEYVVVWRQEASFFVTAAHLRLRLLTFFGYPAEHWLHLMPVPAAC